MPDLFTSSRQRVPWWRSKPALAAAALLVVGLGALIAYRSFKRPADVSRPEISFTATEQPIKRVTGKRALNWPIYGYTRARTRYLPVRGLDPPFRLVWSFRGSSLLEFSPVIARGRLFLSRNAGGVYAYDVDTGRRIWKRKVGHRSAASPAYYRGRVFAVSLHPPRIVALRATSGREIWSKRLPGRSESSPVVGGGKVYFGCECGLLYAVDPATGRTIWTTRLGGAIKAAPALYKSRLYVGDYGGRMSSVRTSDGKVMWTSGSQGRSFGRAGRFYSSPAVAFGRVYAGSLDGRVYSFSIRDGSLAWSHTTGGYVYASPAVADTPATGPTVYIGSYDGHFYALDARSGAVRWRRRAGGRISGAASVIGEVVYYSNLARHSTAGLSTRSGRVLYSVGRGAFNPVVSDGRRIYLTGYSSLFALRPKRDH